MGNNRGEVQIVLGRDTLNESNLAKTIQDELASVGVQVEDVLQEVIDEVGKEAVVKLRNTSPVNKNSRASGRYARGWTYERGKKYAGRIVSVVRNKTDPQLTHLLEYGHPIVRNGKVVGNAQPKEHIKPVADWCSEEVEKRFIKKQK